MYSVDGQAPNIDIKIYPSLAVFIASDMYKMPAIHRRTDRLAARDLSVLLVDTPGGT